MLDPAKSSAFNEGFEFLSGGGGLVSTIDDYAKFCQMLVDGGKANGQQIVSQKSIDQMFAEQYRAPGGLFRFGLGFAIDDVTLGTGENASQHKQCAWGGYASTDFRIIPDAKLVQVVMRQHIPTSPGLANELFAIVNEQVEASTKESTSED